MNVNENQNRLRKCAYWKHTYVDWKHKYIHWKRTCVDTKHNKIGGKMTWIETKVDSSRPQPEGMGKLTDIQTDRRAFVPRERDWQTNVPINTENHNAPRARVPLIVSCPGILIHILAEVWASYSLWWTSWPDFGEAVLGSQDRGD